MFSFEDLKNMVNTFKTGDLEAIRTAVEQLKAVDCYFYAEEFEELWNFLVAAEAIPNREIPIEQKIFEIAHTRHLTLHIKEDMSPVIPSNISLLYKIKELRFNTLLDLYLPDTMSSLQELELLDLSCCGLRKVPLFIFDLVNLETLDLGMNLFDELPREIWKLRKLKVLNLMFCIHLQYIPKEMYSLPLITEIYLAGSNVDQLSPAIAYSTVKVFGWSLSTCPKMMINTVFSKKLLEHYLKETCSFGKESKKKLCSPFRTFKANPFLNIPDDILNKGLPAIKEYLKHAKSAEI